MSEDFYIGYLDTAPPELSRLTRRVLAVIAALVLAVVSLLAAVQTPAEPGEFEYGIQRLFEGELQEVPLPLLREVGAGGSVTNHLLVGEGKHGLPAFARGHGGKRVRFKGTLIRKGPYTMVELNDESSFTVIGPAGSVPSTGRTDAGSVVMEGELVDTKCYFGVMRPATGKVHRGCAARCLAGGVPPGLLVRDADGGAVVVLLTGPGGKRLDCNPQWAARIVRAAGRLEWQDGIPRLEVASLSLARSEDR